LAALVVHVAFTSGKLGVWLYKPFLPLAIEYFIVGILSRLALDYRQISRIPLELFLVIVGISAMFVDPRAVLIWSVFFLAVLFEAGRIAPASKPVAYLMNVFIFNGRLAEIGKWSYSTYLIHIPLFCVVVGGANMLFGQRSQIEYVLLVSVCFPLTLVASKFLFDNIETPFNKRGRAVADKLSRPTPPADGQLVEP
jgi:peptidoglycan/LPS O-acetylase OafA/YrhL